MTHYTNTTNTTARPRPRRKAARYPNAATKRQIIDRLVDRLLCSAAWIGLVTAILLLATV